MSRFVPYLAEDVIERDAAALLSEFERARGIVLEPPIPIEDIIEKHLKLRIEFDDLHARHKVPRPEDGETDILGAIYGDGSIVIDETLDPDENPLREGRYRFTLAHEGGGHWRLHRHLIVKDTAQASLFDGESAPKFICRSSQAKERVEWQADYYASCLLMPRKMVLAAWDASFPDRKQRVLRPRTPIKHSLVEIPKLSSQFFGQVLERETDNQALERFCKPLADRFLVSPIAMRIRLERLGLLHRTVPMQRLLVSN